MTKKEEGVVFQVDDLKGVVLSWLKEEGSKPEDYVTRNGLAFVNGYAKANNTVSLIKVEKFTELTDKYEDLIGKYEQSKKDLLYTITDRERLISEHKLVQDKANELLLDKIKFRQEVDKLKQTIDNLRKPWWKF